LNCKHAFHAGHSPGQPEASSHRRVIVFLGGCLTAGIGSGTQQRCGDRSHQKRQSVCDDDGHHASELNGKPASGGADKTRQRIACAEG
jgi:hypothetical protein